ncbi:MAG: hypothetical protein ACYSUQ_13635 [Planctomycetota bacterium]
MQDLKARAAALEVELAASKGAPGWPPQTYYTTYHVLAGMVLGLLGAASSLLFNLIGALLVGQHPLQLIRVYLTFPLGEEALNTNGGFALAAGCCLYLGTGMIIGIPFHLILSRFFPSASFAKRLAAITALAIAAWLINFYALLSWLQPALIGGSWILAEIPIWVAVLTHLVFGWTMLLIDQWGRFVPYRALPQEVAA